MLFNYPEEATAENWLHDSLISALLKVHDCVASGKRGPNWPNMFPQEHRAKLATRTGLKSRFTEYKKRLSKLTRGELENVREAIVGQNELESLLNCSADCLELDELPETIREPAKELFVFAFELLTAFKVRERQYRAIYESIRDKVCPFCGIETFSAPGAPSEDFDHYLPKRRYPFAAANLRNLAPSGPDCNQKYKKTKNPLFKTDGIRRKALNPYSDKSFGVSLMASVPFGGDDGLTPRWNIELSTGTEEAAETWDTLFCVSKRYERDVLTPSWSRWIEHFALFAVQKGATTDEDLRTAIGQWCELVRFDGFSDRGFLKAAFFEMVVFHIDNGNKAVIRFIRNSVISQ